MKRSLATPLAAATLLVAALTGCSTGSTSGGDSAAEPTATTTAEADAFPVTIEHAFGETTIESEPTRVATLGWTDHDHAVALGVVPVGATKITWGGNEGGSTDWFDAAVEEAGAEAPVRYDDADGAPIDEIAELAPDLILATNSGVTEAEYAKLSKIAPVVAYPEFPWTTDWRTSLETVGKALGRADLAEDVAADTEATIEEGKQAHPQLEGAELIYGYLAATDLSSIGMYAPEDPRVSLMRDFGMVDAPVVADAIKPGEFYGMVSAEKATELESDVFLTWVDSEKSLETIEGDKLLSQIPAIAEGHFYAETDMERTMAATNPTPLSIPVIVEDFLPHVAKAIEGA
ncbi:iron-siderophore ABC transporter substrate-binding protein [Nocardioides sp. S-58]|uniref:Iron-siderophore ABC transporter substrate-binding protein n=1 Tax=Nocardioides renjunii TaxID=3095075 RepID=A0ABU5K888_9ACTN|nr:MULTISPECIES: iron-siderophore ABC transporter substrate-binding protein [unclassified Nocardioides]MDZ5661069.1 iron-siderophore ABC transporter substrate-binding protein [Nocardioides sp. S-58]WQQ22072.1 iron-siderophore ABC transporter substrate-binding protein [Nocardioides sp. S-34]